MEDNNLFKRVGALGFPLFTAEEEPDANLTLADMVKSRDLRLWEGFPVVLANSAEKGLFDYEKTKGYLKKSSDRTGLALLTAMSLALYRFFNLEFSWADKLFRALSSNGKKVVDGFLQNLKSGSDLNVAGRKMSAARLKSIISNYLSPSKERLSELLQAKDELSLEYSLSQVFSSKQKELFLKKLRGEKLTKTEKEYFSRVVKKKVLALANPELHRLSQRVLQ